MLTTLNKLGAYNAYLTVKNREALTRRLAAFGYIHAC